MRDLSYKEQDNAPNLGDAGWGERDWSKVKAELEWLDEQKEEYASQRQVYCEVQEARQKRGDGRMVSGERKWEEELAKVRAAEEKKLQKEKLEEQARQRQREIELEWERHPPTPIPWPGQDSDEE
jgi:hypothetical protein